MSPTDDKIIEFINRERPDIVCIQEFFSIKDKFDTEKKIKNKLQFLPYSHHQFFLSKNQKSKFGILTISKYPIVNRGKILFEGTRNLSIYSDVVINADTIRIYNNHLQSIYLQKKDYDFLANITEEENQIDQVKIISGRVRQAFIKRAKQVKLISENIDKSPYPVLVCGDFNDTPVSFTYRKMRGSLKDAFVESGIGFGNTYGQHLPLFRIDYILCSKDFTSYYFRVNKVVLSDHHPVMCYLVKN